MTEQQHDELVKKMEDKRREWMAEADDDDDGEEEDDDRMLQEAIDMAIQNGKGWASGEKEEYMKMILDDDYIPPIFCSTPGELEKTGLAEAFTALQYDDDPSITMNGCKQKATQAFLDGKKNVVKNIQYYRTAINHYYEAIAWACKIEPIEHRQVDKERTDHEKTFEDYTEDQLNGIKSTLYSNSALCHIQIKNWGHAKIDSQKSINFNSTNIKSLFRLAKSYQMLKEYEEAGNTIDIGLEIDATSKDLLKLKRLLQDKIKSARQSRQRREKIRAERISKIKKVWKHCNPPSTSKDNNKNNNKKRIIQLGRIALVASTSDELQYNEHELCDDDETEDAAAFESRWHHHFPHTGSLPSPSYDPSPTISTGQTSNNSSWTWPCMFLYPSHSQSDFVKEFDENELLAMRMGDMYPELADATDDSDDYDVPGYGGGGRIKKETKTAMNWDYNNEFICSQLAVYFEVNVVDNDENIIHHPEQVERLYDLSSTMKYYESSRALKGDEGVDIMKVVELIERKRLKKQRLKWKQQYKTLWANKPPPSPCIRIHPAMTLRDIVTHPKMIVTNFIVTLIVIPENHPYHQMYLQEHTCIHTFQPTPTATATATATNKE